ncbi:dynein-1-beta heavy chain, flagellar inner arm I1 complex-like isoform X2 [Gigantopelta aegis]|uniref:dynein-1-beta heavy chain, flagellar inner arm I1 complex-like isoform X2 n=1 Tax=Gigantopelta aegis TaxID=1735272 RepID=UPI001B889145|nr:dynein-1-beta heavy chain, flagellar inner arm I1 complex-like isoform X2 [Gigantopelta aegis]
MKDRLSCLLTCLITQSVHHRDILDALLQYGIPSEMSFDWLKALRHRMDILNVLRAKTVTDMMQGSVSALASRPSMRPAPVAKPKIESSDNLADESPKLTRTRTTVSSDYQFSPCYVQQLGNSFYYDYEYLGPQSCLVITPLTERVFLSLTQAAKNFQCGTLIGPAGTGKSETVRELAKLLGRAVFTITCSEAITLPMMLQFVTGMVQSGCWALFDSTDKLTSGLMSVTAQQLDYLQTAMRTLDLSSENQYKIRGQPRFDKKVGAGDKVIRRNSLTTLHPLPRAADSSPLLERQKTVPHGFNLQFADLEKGLVTYFEDTWVAERDRRRRHSIEKEIEIKESEFYKSNRPPSLFYEHVKYRKKKTEDYKHLLQEPMYVHRIIGNVMFNGKLIQASANYGCFMTTSSRNSAAPDIPENFRFLMRPCAVVLPDIQKIVEVILYTNGFQHSKSWAEKLAFFFKRLAVQLPRKEQYSFGLRDIKKIMKIAISVIQDGHFLRQVSSPSDKAADQSKSVRYETDRTEAEERSLVLGISTVLETCLQAGDDSACFHSVLRDIFPAGSTAQQESDYNPYDPMLVNAIKEQLKEMKMEENSDLIDKILQLYSALQTKQSAMLTGAAGSGKSTVLLLLARAINYLNYKLFAPDHSKDDLIFTDRGLLFQMKSQKLKFLQNIDEDLKPQKSTGLFKLQSVCANLRREIESRKKTQSGHELAAFPKVDIVKLYPAAMDPKELLGCLDNGLWHGGLLTKIVQDSYFLAVATKIYFENLRVNDKAKKQLAELPSILLRWIILDGDLDPAWTEGIKSMLDDEKKLTLANGERIVVRENTTFIFETACLSNASPSSVSQCQVIHCGQNTVNWTSLFYTWKQTAKTRWILTTVSIKILENLVEEVFPSTLKFLKSECCSALLTDVGMATAQANEVASGVQEVTAFLKIFTTLLDKYLLREDIEKKLKFDMLDDSDKVNESKSSSGGLRAPSRQIASRLTGSTNIEAVIPNYLSLIKGMFAFSYIWAFGGYLHDKYKERFSKFAHDVLYRASHPIRLPTWGCVFDYYMDESTGSFVRWGEKALMKTLHSFIITPDVERYMFLVDLLLGSRHPVLLSGIPGVGKTSLIEHMVLPRHQSTTVRMSRGMTAAIFQNTLIGHIMELKNKSMTAVAPGVAVAPSAAKQNHLFFIDDLNMAAKVGNNQPPLEVLRQILSEGKCYDKQRQNIQHMGEAQFLAACTLPSSPGFGLGKACHVMSSRLTRQFINLTVFTPGSDTLLSLYSRPLLSWLEEFPTFSVEHHYEFAQAMTVGVLELYQAVSRKLRPTPAHAHYIFSLHDIAHVIHGLMLMSPRAHFKKNKFKKKKIEKTDPKKQKGKKDSTGQDAVVIDGDDEVAMSSDGADRPTNTCAPMMRVIGQLWCHECFRTFSDRLISAEDQQWFKQTLEDVAIKHLCSPRYSAKIEIITTTKEPYSPHSRSSPVKRVRHHTPPPRTPSDFGEDDDDDDGDVDEDNIEDDDEENDDNDDDTLDSTPGDDVYADVAAGQTPPATQGPDASCVESSSREPVKTDLDSTPDGETEAVEVDPKQAVVPSLDTEVTSDTSEDTDQSSSDGETRTSMSARSKSQKKLGFSTKQQMSKRGVTFKAGLIADKQYEAYYGPLLSADEIRSPDSSSSEILFSKYFMAWHTELQGLPVEKGYNECSHENLQEALTSCLTVYNNKTSQRLELVFFREAVYHAARLSRVLAFPGGHALLLGLSYSTGRASLVRLAAYMANCKLYEPKPQKDRTHNVSIVQEHMKRASHHAGVLSRPTVLLIHEDLGQDCLQDVSAIMAEGTSPGLYSEQEILDIVSQMMPGGVQTKRVDKIEQAFERYVRHIKQNMHVIVSVNYKGNSFCTDFHNLHEKVCLYPNLIKYSLCIDVYLPWSYQTYSSIAHAWLEDPKSKISIPWSTTKRAEQITKASYAMAYIHCSAKMATERQFCHQKEPLRFYTPLTFMEFVHLFKVIAAFIVKQELANVAKYEGALCKIDEAFGSIASYRREIDNLNPQLRQAQETIRALIVEVEERKKQYIEALERCKEQEDKIINIQGPLDSLRKSSNTMLDQVSPGYQAAKQAISSLNKNDFDEVRSFRAPPDMVKFVVNALCLLFDKPENWEEGKKLLIKENFLQDLIFFDKSHMPKDKFQALQVYTRDPSFKAEFIATVSKAAAAFCVWVHAIDQYAVIYQSSQTLIESLGVVEERYSKAQMKLGKLRVEANRIKSGLESKIALHREALKKAKTIEKQIQAIEKKISRASNLMENMSMQHFLWRSELKKAKRHVRCTPGDALITAACVCYHGPLDDKFRSDLLQDWLNRCRQGSFHIDSFIDHEQYSVTSGLELLIQQMSSHHQAARQASDLSEASVSGVNFDLPTAPQVRTFKYIPAVYDSRKYYKSELKKQDTMESVVPNVEFDDSDDEEELSVISTRSGYTLQDILSDFDELSGWRMSSLPTDLHSVQNALLMRVSCFNRKHCWPLLIDPDNQATVWVKALQKSQNLFCEKDLLMEGEDLDEGLPMELIYDHSSDEMSGTGQDMDPPPSRGTALTFSDTFTEFTINDSSTVCTESQTIQTSRMSNQTCETDDLRPVTSVTNSWETFSMQADQLIDHPDNNLWIIEADDPSLKSRLINAVVHGVTVLVTHLERKPLDPLFRGLLLKHFYVDKEGNKAVRVGGMIFKYHPNFCLYLSTTVPLFVKGDGLHSFPVHHLCCINMALSDEAIINKLLFETMKFERKEFEGQKRSNENDIILHRQRLAREHEAIREKTLNLDVPLLEDRTMLESLLACQSNVEKNRIILEETRYMGDHLEGKFAHYVPIMTQSTMLYNIIKKMFVLHPCYYLPFYKFTNIFMSVLRSRYRGKGSLGAPQVRAKELADATMSAIFRHMSMMMFEQHFNMLLLLVSVELMKWSHKASAKEVSLFISGFEKLGLDEQGLLDMKPAWMTDKAWVDCNVLESLHHPFHGLCNSLINNSLQWNEYFKAPIALVNPIPGSTLQELSLFQKCLLWKFCCPQRMTELSKAMTTFELGSVEEPVTHYNIFDVFDCTDQFTPTVFILPTTPKQIKREGTEGYPYVNPAHEVKRLAKESGMEGKIRIMNFGVRSQMSEVKHAIVDCMQCGHWLLLQNYHLAGNTDIEFFSILKNIIHQKPHEEARRRENTNISDDGHSLLGRSNPSLCSQEVKIHNKFRLWITTRADGELSVPGVLIQHGLRVTCEATSNFKSTLKKSYRSVSFLLNNWKDTDQESQKRFSKVMPIALFHSLLLQQSYYGKHAFTKHHTWTLTDLAMAVDFYKKLVCRVDESDCRELCAMMAQVYSNHCVDENDAKIAHALICQLSQYSVTEKDSTEPAQGVAALLEKLLDANKHHASLQRVLDTIEDTSSRVFSLPQDAELQLMSDKSRIVMKDMVQVAGAPELLLNVINPPSSTTVPNNLIPNLINLLRDCPRLPATSRDQINPVDVFLHYEVAGYRRLLRTVQTDLDLLLRCSRGEVSLNKNLMDTLDSICQDGVPAAWLADTFPSCLSLKLWLNILPERMRTLITYLDGDVLSYNLTTFLRPDRFFDAVVQTYARKYFKDANSIRLDVQVMPVGVGTAVAPKTGVFISGLKLNNASWDNTRSVLIEQLPNTGSSQDLPIIWLKPVQDLFTESSDVPKSETKHDHTFSCPLYCSVKPEFHVDRHIVQRLPLPSGCDIQIWIQKRVFLSASLPCDVPISET